MHEPIAKHVEEYLTRSDRTNLPAEFSAHLVACGDCREELKVMEQQSRIVRVFKPAVEDFYFTNPIARSSAVMAECSALAGKAARTAAE